jgi:GMP synthase-like glutamine amidotransferase
VTGRTALVVANAEDADAGFVGDRLEQLGFALRTVLRDAGETPSSVAFADDPDLILLLGSEWSVWAPANPDARDAECALVRSAREAGVPVLGLCYGAQLLAHAFGGSVSLAPKPEIGFVEVDTSDAELVPSGPWTAFHLDVLQAPPDATVVARNACGIQAFVLPGVLGVQFHPEVRPGILADWARKLPELVSGAGLVHDDLVQMAMDREEESRAAAYALVDAFLSRVTSAV